MPEKMDVFKCDLCGNVVEVLTAGAGDLVCCGQDMKKLTENTTDAAVEKHVPALEKKADGWQVNVGSVDHPMTEEHLIEWIELIVDGTVYREFLKAGDKPAAFFPVTADKVTARAYCNLHGLWKAE
jgi:superoxide reductase